MVKTNKRVSKLVSSANSPNWKRALKKYQKKIYNNGHCSKPLWKKFSSMLAIVTDYSWAYNLKTSVKLQIC